MSRSMRRRIASTVTAAALLSGGLATGAGTASAESPLDTGSAVLGNLIYAPIGSADVGSDLAELAIANPYQTIMVILVGGSVAIDNIG
ncbi:hypothetical protein [Rhodococcus maanshanensis]|uniref:Uncharacterized protein n=1 Tax=Rhodococcus maanshanensis TaxID=183556 RepID=A0A1H7MH61_9NOCA|nr:hypothetical protein [Rhodococcus maanshanensis]SEL10419.1 hypothetical protein SAMN05444583_1068 [Rhodococcus maanshanensis]